VDVRDALERWASTSTPMRCIRFDVRSRRSDGFLLAAGYAMITKQTGEVMLIRIHPTDWIIRQPIGLSGKTI
jgi:hypothetical protein